MATMKGKRVLTSLYLDPPAAEELKRLSAATRVPQAVYLREAVELLLAHYREVLSGTPIRRPPVLERLLNAAIATPRKPK